MQRPSKWVRRERSGLSFFQFLGYIMNSRFVGIAALLGLALFGVSSAQAIDLARGKVVYDRYCASCHGFNGISVMPDAPHLKLNQGLIQPDLAIINKLRSGAPKKPPFMGVISDADLASVVAYSRTLR